MTFICCESKLLMVSYISPLKRPKVGLFRKIDFGGDALYADLEALSLYVRCVETKVYKDC